MTIPLGVENSDPRKGDSTKPMVGFQWRTLSSFELAVHPQRYMDICPFLLRSRRQVSHEAAPTWTPCTLAFVTQNNDLVGG